MKEGQILAVKYARLSKINHLSMSTEKSRSRLFFNPTHVTRAVLLNNWFQNTDLSGAEIFDLSIQKDPVFKTIDEIKQSKGVSDNYTVYGHLGSIYKAHDPDYIAYRACPNSYCRRKIHETDENEDFYCKHCKNSFKDCNFSYNFKLEILDSTGALRVKAFDLVGQSIFERPANAFINDPNLADLVILPINIEFEMTITARMDNNTKEINYILHNIKEIEPKDIADVYFQEIMDYLMPI